jgi:hypothetical protein
LVQISSNLVRNTDHGKAITTGRIVHKGRTMVVVATRLQERR